MTEFTKLKKVLIANRGEIACRIIRSCKSNSIQSVAIFTKQDYESLHVVEADESVLLNGSGSQGYLDIENIVQIAIDHKVDAVIPGYGFLSENQNFVGELEKNNIKFIGPSSESVENFGLKHIARDLAISAEVSVVPGSGVLSSYKDAIETANFIGFPIILKASAGGGGMGMKVCYLESELKEAYEEVKSRSGTLFKNSTIFLEKYISEGRHIEVQVFGNGKGDILALGERECSIQRRHQKVIEETPSPFIQSDHYSNKKLRNTLCNSAKRLAALVNYKSAGTIEFLVDNSTGNYYFLEMNTRLQVEHGITELCYGVDLVYMMLLQCEYELRGETGIPLEILENQGTYTLIDGIPQPSGHAMEIRLYAENPLLNFAPSPGVLQNLKFQLIPNSSSSIIRIDHWVKTGVNASPFFDPLLAKIMVHSPNRDECIKEMLHVLSSSIIQGPPTNLAYCSEIIQTSQFKTGFTLTSFLNSFKFKPSLLEFEEGGLFSTVQDLPGREIYNGGIPHSGPMDDLSFSLANLLVGNERGMEGIEIAVSGPLLKFHSSATISLCGGDFEFKINGKPAKLWTSISIPGGSLVAIGAALGSGGKAYLAIKGGLPNVATFLGSKSCSPAINLGGYQGRKFLNGDCIELPNHEPIAEVKYNYTLPEALRPLFPTLNKEGKYEWTVRCLNGPHSSQEILSDKGRAILYSSEYIINHNSNRGSLALDGPACEFSREHGGDGGNYPSNIIEYIYPYRGVSCIGDKTVIGGPDGITLSGFICPIVPISIDWWKFGQATVGSVIRFKNITFEDAIKLLKQRKEFLASIDQANLFTDELAEGYQKTSDEDVILYCRKGSEGMPQISFRQAGERAIIVDHDVAKFSLTNCGRLYKFLLDLQEENLNGITRLESANGAMTVFFDPLKLERSKLLEKMKLIDSKLSLSKQLEFPSRKFRLPVCMDHPLIKETIDRYMQAQRPYAAYLPSNLDYVMKSSCVDTIEEFKSRAFNSPQVILAVSFLCASTLMVHLDPRDSFISGKYNPPRTFSPAGSITTGSVVQGMRAVDGPGGYMVWGAGLRYAFWDTFSMRENFKDGLPWFLKPFDQIEFYEVDSDKLDELSELNMIGKYSLKPEESVFRLDKYAKFAISVEEEVQEIRKRQVEASARLKEQDMELFNQWQREVLEQKEEKAKNMAAIVGESYIPIVATMVASVFKVIAKPGQKIKSGDVLVVLEAMKTEINIRAPQGGDEAYEIVSLGVSEGEVVSSGDVLCYVSKA